MLRNGRKSKCLVTMSADSQIYLQIWWEVDRWLQNKDHWCR